MIPGSITCKRGYSSTHFESGFKIGHLFNIRKLLCSKKPPKKTTFWGMYKTVDRRPDRYISSCMVSCSKNSKRRIPPTRLLQNPNGLAGWISQRLTVWNFISPSNVTRIRRVFCSVVQFSTYTRRVHTQQYDDNVKLVF